jgi:hypothetical protein
MCLCFVRLGWLSSGSEGEGDEMGFMVGSPFTLPHGYLILSGQVQDYHCHMFLIPVPSWDLYLPPHSMRPNPYP